MHFKSIASHPVTLTIKNRLFFSTPKSFEVPELLVLRPQPSLSSSEYTSSDPSVVFVGCISLKLGVLGCFSFAVPGPQVCAGSS